MDMDMDMDMDGKFHIHGNPADVTTQIRWRRCGPDLVRQYRQLISDSMLNRQPVQLA